MYVTLYLQLEQIHSFPDNMLELEQVGIILTMWKVGFLSTFYSHLVGSFDKMKRKGVTGAVKCIDNHSDEAT